MENQPIDVSPQSNKQKWIIGGVIVVLLIAGIAMYNRSQTIKDPNNITVGDQNSIDVGAQDPDSVAVLISQVSFITPGFVVIQENNNGVVGKVLTYSKLFTPGFYKNQTVIMNMKAGASYFATLYGDNGNGQFDIATDTILKDPAGVVVQMQFKVNMTSADGESKG
jgi:hypothetical protein